MKWYLWNTCDFHFWNDVLLNTCDFYFTPDIIYIIQNIACLYRPSLFHMFLLWNSYCIIWKVCGWPTVGVGGFSKVVPPSTMRASPLIFHGHHQGSLNNPIFSNLRLCAACWAHSMCHHELWPKSLGYAFSFCNSCWGPTGGKHYPCYQKMIIIIFRFVLQHFAIPGYFPYILFYRHLFSLLSSGWFVIAICVELLSPMTSQLKGYPHFFCVSLISFFFQVHCGMYIVYYLCGGR